MDAGVEPRDLGPDGATENNSLTVIVVTAIMTFLATVAITLRIYGCLFILRRRLYFEEWLSVINQIDLWLTAAFTIHLFTATKAGTHWHTLTDAERTRAVLWHNVLTGPAVLSLGLPKLAVVSLLCRIFKPSRRHKAVLWTAAILCILNFTGVILLAWLPCRPLAAGWDVSITEKRCIDPWKYVKYCYYASTFSAALDVYLALYPAFVFRNLGWNRRKKLTLSLIMGLGLFASGVACYKITFLEVLSFTKDFTYDVSRVIIWTIIEANVIMIAACVPALHPVYDKVLRRRHRPLDCARGDGAPGGWQQRQQQQQQQQHMRQQGQGGWDGRHGFWTVVMMRLSSQMSGTTLNTTTAATDHSHLSRGGAGGGVPDGKGPAHTASTLAVPMRSLEDAADVQHPPEAIWAQRVNGSHGVGRSGRS